MLVIFCTYFPSVKSNDLPCLACPCLAQSHFIVGRVLNSLFMRASTFLFADFVALVAARFYFMSTFHAVLVLRIADVASLMQSLISVVAILSPAFSFNNVPCSVMDACMLDIVFDTVDQSAVTSVTAGALHV